METRVFKDSESVAQEAATWIAEMIRETLAGRDRFIMAVSGGKTPWEMLRLLSKEDLQWEKIHLVQVDERVAPDGDPDRNLTHLFENMVEQGPLKPEQILAMPVGEPDLEIAAAKYASALLALAGDPPVLDLVHLGMGPDGHTASLTPGNPALDVTDVDVAPAGPYQGRFRLTLTYPMINRARRILWVITGGEKAAMLKRMQQGDPSIPAGRVNQSNALVMADQDAATTV